MRYKAELESELKKVGNKWKPKLNELHLTKEQVTDLFYSIQRDRFSGITIFIGERLE